MVFQSSQYYRSIFSSHILVKVKHLFITDHSRMGAPVVSPQSSQNRLHQSQPPPQLSQSQTKQLYYSDDLYTPEALFSSWLNLSFFSVTTALLFYHMTVAKSIEADPRIAAFLSLSLMGISCAYVYFSVGPYWSRMNHIQQMCVDLKECSDAQAASIRQHKNIYISLGFGTIFIEVVVAILILYKTYSLL